MAVAVAAHEGAQVLGGNEPFADLAGLLLKGLHVAVRGRHLEDHIRQRTRRQLLELILVALVVGLQVALRYRDERIGHRGVLLAGPLAREGLVGSLHAVGHLQRVDIRTAAHQPDILLQQPLQPRLLVELRPGLLRLGRRGPGEEVAHGRHVVLSRAGIGKGVVERLRHVLAADHGRTLGLRHAQAYLLETGLQHVLGDKRLPDGIGQHGRLLLVALLRAALRLDPFVLLVVLRIVDLVTVDDADLRIVARESHLGLQGEDECQEGQCDDNRQHHAELGS